MAFLNIRFPFEENENNDFFAPDTTTVDTVKSNLLHVLVTSPGERFYRPNFGCNLKDKLFELRENGLNADIRKQLNDCIKQSLPSVTITDIVFEDDSRTSLTVRLTFNIQEGTLVRSDSISVRF